MNQFGGNWTEQKMEMIIAYAKAYLVIMNKYPNFKILYFDGFAGSGQIENSKLPDEDSSKGTALRILEIDTPKRFDLYYFVENNKTNKIKLEENIKINFDLKSTHVVYEDCNIKLKDMANFLKVNRNWRTLAFIDPYGMSVDWDSIQALKGLGVDLWILVPTGIGINRLLKKNGDINVLWLEKLQKFLGLEKEYILNHFYKETKSQTLFGEEILIEKERKAIEKAGKLYEERLKTVFKFVSQSFVMKNSTNSIMYHFMMATNNASALKIANEVIKPKYKF